MEKITALFDLFRKGQTVMDPKIWKDRYGLTIALSSLILVMVPVLKQFGVTLPLEIGESVATDIATVVAIVAGLLSNYTTSDKVGLPPKSEE